MTRANLRMLGVGLVAPTLLLAACANGDGGEAVDDADGQETIEASIGITQIVSHPALDAAREGFKDALADDGIEADYDEQNAQGDQATATSIANTFATADHDLILAVATPAAQATAQAIPDTPILLTAVTDPEEAGLVDSWEEPGGNVSGTSDLNPVADQLELLTEIDPDAESVGIVYSSGEVNSEIQVELAEEAAEDLGLEIASATVSNSGEVQQAAESLDVDAFYVPTDNTVVSAMESLLQVAEDQQLPVIAGEGESVEAGALATYGIDYDELGYQTGEMAIEVLREDTDVAEMPIETQSELSLVVNLEAADRIDVELSDELVERADEVLD